MCYKVTVSKDWDQGESAKERTYITFGIKNKCVSLFVGKLTKWRRRGIITGRDKQRA